MLIFVKVHRILSIAVLNTFQSIDLHNWKVIANDIALWFKYTPKIVHLVHFSVFSVNLIYRFRRVILIQADDTLLSTMILCEGNLICKIISCYCKYQCKGDWHFSFIAVTFTMSNKCSFIGVVTFRKTDTTGGKLPIVSMVVSVWIGIIFSETWIKDTYLKFKLYFSWERLLTQSLKNHIMKIDK